MASLKWIKKKKATVINRAIDPLNTMAIRAAIMRFKREFWFIFSL